MSSQVSGLKQFKTVTTKEVNKIYKLKTTYALGIGDLLDMLSNAVCLHIEYSAEVDNNSIHKRFDETVDDHRKKILSAKEQDLIAPALGLYEKIAKKLKEALPRT